MPQSTKIKTRIINKHATAAVWTATGDKFNPLEGELIVYDTDDNYSVPRLKIGTDKYINKLDFISNGMVDNDTLVCDSNGIIALNEKYVEYLDAQLYAYPSISAFNIVEGNQEVGTSVTISTFTHKETNSKNIEGSLKLTSNKNSTINFDVTPTDVQQTVTFNDSYTFTTNTTLTYTLSGRDTRGNTITKTDSISSYFPSYIGAVESPSISSSDTSLLTKVASSSLSGTRAVDATNHYIYFLSTTPIKSIKSGGFDVSYSKQADLVLNINGISRSYYVYRTNEIITSTLSYVIS